MPSPKETQMPRSSFDIPRSILVGETADVYFSRALAILKTEKMNPLVTMEIFPRLSGLLCGMSEVRSLLSEVLPKGSEVWAIDEGDRMTTKEVILRIRAPYAPLGLYETAMLGMLAHSSGWAT